MRRREFITLAGGAVVWPLMARAQQAKMPVIGFFNAGLPEAYSDELAAFRKGLSEMGYVEGRNVAIEFRWGLNDPSRVPDLVADLVRRQVTVIAAVGTASAAISAKGQTATIPIVFSTSGNPVQLGLVASLARPGANVTGYNDMSSELLAKHLGLLHELVPSAARFGVLLRHSNPWVDGLINDSKSAAAAMGRDVENLFASTDREIDAAFGAIVQQRIEALAVTTDTFLQERFTQILILAARHVVPAIYPARLYTDAGGLMSYGPIHTEQGRQAGIYTGRILKGEKPENLPVMQPTKFELVINLQTARTMGIDVPPTLLASADDVIE